MLTNLDFLKQGAAWPPEDMDTRDRLAMYQANRLLFKGYHANVYQKQFERIERVIANFRDVVSYAVILNYQKLISLKVADLLFGEAPKISADDEADESIDAAIKDIKTRSDLINTSYMTAIDISRFGDGLFYVYNDGKGGVIDITTPGVWYPVVDEMNIRKRKYEVLATIIYKTEMKAGKLQQNPEYLSIKIFDEVMEETRKHKLVYGSIGNLMTIGEPVEDPTQKPHGLDTFPIIQIPNVITSEDITGMDDYTDVDTIISELLIRVGQISRVLDKHAAPSVTGPQTCLEQDKETGEWRLKMGNYFPRNTSEEPKPEYIVWDGQMAPSFKQAELLINQLYVISEMGAALLGDFSNTQSGQVPSGTAMRRMMMAPLAKVNRIRMRFDPAMKKAIALASQLTTGEKIRPDDIAIEWQDGLPSDPAEAADIEAVRTGQKATSSVQSAIERLDGVSEEKAIEEQGRIMLDEEPITQP